MVIGSWKKVNITELLKPNGIKIGPFGSQLKKELFVTNGLYKVYGQENVYAKDFKIGDRFMTRQHFEKLSSCELKPGDFVMTTMGTVGKCAIVPDDIQTGVMDSHLIRMRFNEKCILPSYLLQLFSPEYSFLSSQTDKLSVGGIMDGLSVKIVSSLQVECPEDIKEQQKIAEALSDMDNLISSLEKLIEKKNAIKQACLKKMFPTNGEMQPHMRLPGFTDSWKPQKLGTITAYKNGKSYENQQIENGKYELVTLNSISIDGGLKASGKFVNNAYDTLLKNDLVMVLSDVGHGDLLGRVALIPQNNKFVLNQRVALLRIVDQTDPLFLFFYINANQNYFKTKGAGSSQLNISKECVEQFVVNLPSLKEQIKISEFFCDLDNVIENSQQKLEKCKKIKQGMMQQLLTGKIRLVGKEKENGRD